MPTEPTQDSRTAVELRVIVIEDAHGALNVQWAATTKGGEIVVPMRPAHVIGMLQSAAFVLMGKHFSGFREKVEEAAKKPKKS